LYHRFHLFFPRKDHGLYVRTVSISLRAVPDHVGMLQEVCLAALYVSTKMNDTLKKPRDILMASYAVRYPELAVKPKSLSGDIDIDPNVRAAHAGLCAFFTVLLVRLWKWTDNGYSALSDSSLRPSASTSPRACHFHT
jgi:hypothetical protein